MLLPRVITGIILALIGIAIVFLASNQTFILITALILLMAAFEWTKLCGISSLLYKAIYVAIIAALMWLVDSFVPVMPLMLVALLFWLYALYLVCLYPRGMSQWTKKSTRAIMGFFVLVPSWMAINYIRVGLHHKWSLLLMFLIVWSADIGAYFAGKRFGQRRLMPMVSPKKTWEGFFGGLALSMLVAWIGLILAHVAHVHWLVIMILVAVLNVFSVAGDLFESMLKRHEQLKDSGSILPGHGGVLDRLDSLMAVAPVFVLGFLLYWF